jgi:hypothetical protein
VAGASIPQSTEELLTRWYKRLRESQFSHYEAAKLLERRNLWFGIPVVVLSTVVGTSIFATLNATVEKATADIAFRIVIGMISVAAAVLAGLQTFLRFAERADKHRSIGAQAGALRREIEQLLAVGGTEHLEADTLDNVRKEIDKLFADAPSVPELVWKRVSQTLNADSDASKQASELGKG